MKDKYIVPSDRYHRLHRFIALENGNYRFEPEEDWMPIYVTKDRDGDGIDFIDTEGGPCIGVGFKTSEFEVTDIINTETDIEFKLKEL